MTKRSFFSDFLAKFGGGSSTKTTITQHDPPLVPVWRPSFSQPTERVINRIRYYTDEKKDFAAFRHGTCVLLDADLSDDEAARVSLGALSAILGFHPDMTPNRMDDGNVLVQYNHPAMNVVLRDIAKDNWFEIERRHLDGLTPSEVLLTPLGPNTFDEFGKLALLGRAWMFMDAQEPEIVGIERSAGSSR